MKVRQKHRIIACGIALAWPAFVHAQSHDARTNAPDAKKDRDVTQRGAMDHAKMNHGGTTHESADHAAMDHDSIEDGSKKQAMPMDTTALPAPDHIPPAAPTHEMGDMSHASMVEVMGMDDRAMFGRFSFDRLERIAGDGHGAIAWSMQGWYGGDIDKLGFRSEGTRADGAFEHADAELSWNHAIASFWNSQLGVRRDFGRGADRTWAAFGVHGLAPYWFDIAATAYVGEQGRAALRLEAEYDMLLTQRWVLQPRVELNAYGKDDSASRIGSGLSDATFGLRLRYEVRREFAPYVGVEWSRRFGRSADFAHVDGESVGQLQWVAGLRCWF